MIIFHEGMPRSGKSYASIKDHIVPSLAKGRKVYARLDGINFRQIGELAGLTEEQTRQLLIELSETDVTTLEKYEFERDALIVIDEAQNYWQATRGNLNAELLKWIAEHGHHGHDVLLMGQLAKDVHRSWINRANRKVQFFKKDVVGKDNEYKWVVFYGAPDAKGSVRFTEVSRGDAEYDPRFFGCYKSHSEGTENKENYEDSRANVLKSAAFRRYLPAYIVFAVASFGYVIYAFSGGLLPEEKQAATVETTTVTVPAGKEQITTYQSGVPVKKEIGTLHLAAYDVRPQPDLVDQLSAEHRIRVSAFWKTPKEHGVYIEWRNADRVIERFSNKQLHALGWTVWIAYDSQIVRLTKGDRSYVATSWPVADPLGKAPESHIEQVKGQPKDGKTA
jgi:zona occludens toxin